MQRTIPDESRQESIFLGLSQRIPPSNLEAEQALLGALLANNKAYDRVRHFLKVVHFADPIHGRIYGVIQERIERGQLADAVTLRNVFDGSGVLDEVGGAGYLAQLLTAMVGIINAGEYGLAIFDAWARRELIQAGENAINRAFSADVDAAGAAAAAMEEIGRLQAGPGVGRPLVPLGEAVDAALQEADDIAAGRKTLGLSTGMQPVDDVLGGLEPDALYVLAGRPGSGKAQPLDAGVLLRDGTWKKMGAIKRGDRLASVDGAESRVLAIHPRGERQVYRVTLSDGRSTECCADHLWRVRHRHWPTPRVISTDRLRAMLERTRYQKRLSIEVVNGEFGARREHLPLDPYVLGVLLGDGSLMAATASFTSADKELVDEVSLRLGLLCKVARTSGRLGYRISSGGRTTNAKGQFKSAAWLPAVLDSLGVAGKRAEAKAIPAEYLRAERPVRLDLLRGLMDTDGTVGRLGAVSFSSSSRQLAEDVLYLARSLGASGKIVPKAAWYKKDGERKHCLPSFRVHLRHPHAEEFFLLKRKSDRAVRGHNATVGLTVSSVVETRVATTRCITVSHPAQTYVTDDFIVTHNSALGHQWALNVARSGVGVLEISLEMNAKALARRALAAAGGVPLWAMRTGKHGDYIDAILRARKELKDLPLLIEDGGNLTVAQIESVARAASRRIPLGLVMVDHLHIVTGDDPRKTETEKVRAISNGMKRLAKSLRVPVLALAQLNRGVESRDDKRPGKADLRQSGAIEEDADAIAFLHRPELYIPKSAPDRNDGESDERYAGRVASWHTLKAQMKGVAELIFDKVREGDTPTVKLQFDGPTTSFRVPGQGGGDLA